MVADHQSSKHQGRINAWVNVRLGSEADIQRRLNDVRFTPKSGMVQHDCDLRFAPESGHQQSVTKIIYVLTPFTP